MIKGETVPPGDQSGNVQRPQEAEARLGKRKVRFFVNIKNRDGCLGGSVG